MKRDLVRRVKESWVENVPGSNKWAYIFEIAKHSARISQVNKKDGTVLKEFRMRHYYLLEETQFGRYNIPPEIGSLRYYLVYKLGNTKVA